MILTEKDANPISQRDIFEQIKILSSKKLRLETDADYATINSVGVVIEDLEKQITTQDPGYRKRAWQKDNHCQKA